MKKGKIIIEIIEKKVKKNIFIGTFIVVKQSILCIHKYSKQSIVTNEVIRTRDEPDIQSDIKFSIRPEILPAGYLNPGIQPDIQPDILHKN